MRLSLQLTTGFADLRGYETGFVAGQAEQQVPPLRFASVGMTILLENGRYRVKSSISNEFVIRPKRTRISCCVALTNGHVCGFQ
jgi:hypothetical protein